LSTDSDAQRITTDLDPQDYERILYHGCKIRALNLLDIGKFPEPDLLVLPLLWVCRPNSVTLLPMLCHVERPLKKFHDFAFHTRFVDR
jgi:hypothetical protein